MQAEIMIDFLTFSVTGGTHEEDAEAVIENILIIDIDKFKPADRGINFYRKSLSWGNIRVLYEGNNGMGICVNMSGQGCREYEEYASQSIISLLKRLNENETVHITRLDIACDDKAGSLDLDRIWEYANDGRYRTRLVARNHHESFTGKDSGAKTLYFGSPSSQYRIRIYDKAKQTQSDSPWIRFELVLKAEYAEQAVAVLADSEKLGESVAGILSEKFAFINKDDSNISRCSIAGWWQDFLGQVQAVSLTSKQKPSHAIEEHRQWLRKNCSRVIAKVVAAIGQEAFDKEIAAYGKERLTAADKHLIQDYRDKNGGEQ